MAVRKPSDALLPAQAGPEIEIRGGEKAAVALALGRAQTAVAADADRVIQPSELEAQARVVTLDRASAGSEMQMREDVLITCDELAAALDEAAVLDASWIYGPFNHAAIDVRSSYAASVPRMRERGEIEEPRARDVGWRGPELREMFETAGIDRGTVKATTCYFGLGASVVATALEIARLDPVLVYPGSLVEYAVKERLVQPP